MSLARRIQRKKLRKAVLGQMGALTGKPLLQESNPEIQGMFHPHSGGGPVHSYPLFQIGHEYSKMPRETLGRWIDIAHLRGVIRKNSAISSLLKQNPKLEVSFRESVENALRERSIKATKFWTTAPKGYIDKIIAGGKGRPNAMNEKTGEIIAEAFGKTTVPRTILDIGTFAGGTISAVVAKLSPEQRRMLNVVLVDIAGDVVKKHAVPALVNLGVQRQNIKVIPASFYSAAVAFKQMPKPLHEYGQRIYGKEFINLIGKVDAVTAGAATINFATDLWPYLRSIKRLLKKNGVFVNWDWGSAEVRSPEVNVPALKRAVLAETPQGKVTHYDAYVSFLNFWLGFFNYPEPVKQRMFSDIERSRKFNFIKWCEKNIDWMERERRNAGGQMLEDPAGFRNRAYRTGGAMYNVARKIGLNPGKPMYPLAKPGIKDTGNVNWMTVIRKD